MISPESIVVSLEWAKKLKEAGWPQERQLFYWHQLARQNDHKVRLWNGRKWWDEKFVSAYAAPTAEEILRRMPGIILTMEAPCVLEAHFYPTLMPPHVTVGYIAGGLNEAGWRTWMGHMLCQEADTLTNAAAAMWVYLAEHKLLPSPQ